MAMTVDLERKQAYPAWVYPASFEEAAMVVSELTFDELSEALAYDPNTGEFTWKIDVARNVKAGSSAGTFKSFRHKTSGEKKTYLYIRYKDREMVATRVAWFLHYGEWPPQIVQFVDGDTKNLRIANLKLSMFPSKIIKKDGRRHHKMSKEASRHYGLKRYYGLSVAEYAEMFRKQDGKCAICRQPELGKDRHGNARPLAVDHCHGSGNVRELLCYACNSMLGQARDNKETLEAAIAYLDKHSVTKQ
jgi:hypothetical protein